MTTAETSDRCSWCLGSDLYIDYHDTEWGFPISDDNALFELINLEGAQAGLSWITILNKREGYRKLFAGFDIEKVARFTDSKLDRIATNPAIVRHRQKVGAVRANARAVLAMREQGEAFGEFLWSFVDGQSRQNRYRKLSDVPASTAESTAMSRALKKRGFKFVGATTCYAFMQAAGMVNDHLLSCPIHDKVAKAARRDQGPVSPSRSR